MVALKVDLYSDAGHVSNESPVGFLGSVIQNCYFVPNLLYMPHVVNTDTAANTWCRTPGELFTRHVMSGKGYLTDCFAFSGLSI